jgi:DNA-binding NarL/FixJ family response regulator
MTVNVVYLCNGQGPEATVLATLRGAGCAVECVHAAGAAWVKLRRLVEAGRAHAEKADERVEGVALVAEAQAGAVMLLELLRKESHNTLSPPVLVVDQEGNDLSVVMRAMRAGVSGYVLTTAPPLQVACEVQLFMERVRAYCALRRIAGIRVKSEAERECIAG